MAYNETEAIREHYDRVSPLYKDLWGPHIHHGYFPTGTESREAAVENLIKLIVERSGISNGSRVLDVGCGLGGTAMWLAEKMDCNVTGITISPVQVEIATKMSKHLRTKPDFRLGDANRLSVSTSFDAIWAVEVLAHLSDRPEFFKRASRLLLPGGNSVSGRG